MDERAEKKLNKRLADLERQRQLMRDDFVQVSVKTKQGRAYFWWVMEIAKTNSNPFNGNALGTSFQCGEMNVGQHVRNHLEDVAPDGYLHMLKERKEEQANARTNIDTSNGPDSDTDTTEQ